jgi:hypothetical protein
MSASDDAAATSLPLAFEGVALTDEIRVNLVDHDRVSPP